MQGQGPDWGNLTHQVQHLVGVLPPKILTPDPCSSVMGEMKEASHVPDKMCIPQGPL